MIGTSSGRGGCTWLSFGSGTDGTKAHTFGNKSRMSPGVDTPGAESTFVPIPSGRTTAVTTVLAGAVVGVVGDAAVVDVVDDGAGAVDDEVGTERATVDGLDETELGGAGVTSGPALPDRHAVPASAKTAKRTAS